MPPLPFIISNNQVNTVGPQITRTPPGPNMLQVAGGELSNYAADLKQARVAQESAAVSRALAETKSEWTAKFLEAQNNAAEGAPDFTNQFLSEYDSAVYSKVKNLSPEAQEFFKTRAMELKAGLYSDAQRFEVTARNKKAAADATEAANLSINAVRSNPALLDGTKADLSAMVDNLPAPPAVKAALRKQFGEQVAIAAVQGMSERNPTATLAALNSGAFDDDLTPQQKSQLINAAEVDIRQRRAEARAAAAEARAVQREKEFDAERQRQIDAAKFEVAVREGKFDREDIEERWADGKGSMRPGEYVELVSLQARAAAERAKADAGVNKVRAALDSGVGLDYKNADDRKAVDQYFQQYFAPSLANEDAETQASAVVNYADKVGMVPESVQSAMRVNLRNGTPDQIVRASDFVARVQERNPQLLNDFSADEIAMGTMVTQQVRSGVEPDRAVLQAREAMAVPEAVKNERTIRFRTDKLADKIPTLLKNEFANFFSRNPEVPDYATAEFRQSFENYYRTTGDAAVAEKAALADFKRVWGESEVNGRKQLMRYAPEKFYAVAGETDYIREQLLSEVRPLVYGDKVDSVVLVPDSKTAREASTGLPTYAVMQQDDQGRFIPVMREGVPQRFRPDPSKMADEYKARKLKEAEKLRDSTRRKNEPFKGFPSIEKEVEGMGVIDADR